MPSTREIKRRIRSVSNIRQITKAMQLVATSKMKRAQKKSSDASAYARWALEILKNITRVSKEAAEHPYWKANEEGGKALSVLITSDRGFCGGMNLSLLNEVLIMRRAIQSEGGDLEIVTVGKKGRDFMKRAGCLVTADFSGIGDRLMLKDIFGIARVVMDDFVAGQYSRVYLAFTQFVNTLSQRPMIRRILPVDPAGFREISELQNGESGSNLEYLLEPDPGAVFERLVPHLIEISVYKAFLENQASEHSARMVAMKNATERAGELIQDLRLEYNQARQAGITREIAEISSGATGII